LTHRARTDPLISPFRISRGEGVANEVVEISISWSGLIGSGEATPQEHDGESVASTQRFLDDHARSLGDSPFALEEIGRRLSEIPGAMAAKAGIDAALHDLCAKHAGLPLWKFLGVPRVSPPTTFTISLDDPDTMARGALAAAPQFRAMKVKLGGLDGLDLDRVRAIRRVVSVPLCVDVNEYWTFEEAMDVIPALVELGVGLVEQPLAAASEDGPRLKALSPLPIYADEGVMTLADVAPAAERAHGINVKLAKCGGIREAIRMVHAARALGLGVMVGCMGESSLGIAAACPVASLCDHVDLDGNLFLASDPWEGVTLTEGVQVPSERAGLGVARRGRWRCD
jgi:L-alanine-DL-glutamate epimerase-like enolase superfamily enzyme